MEQGRTDSGEAGTPPPEALPVPVMPPENPERDRLNPEFTGELVSALQAYRQRLEKAAPAIAEYTGSSTAVILTAVETKVRKDKAARSWLAKGVTFPAFPVIGSSDTSQPLRPSLVIGTFDPHPLAQMRAAEVAFKATMLYGELEADTEDDRKLQQIVADDTYVPQRRVRVPEPHAGGYELYFFNVLLRRDDPEAVNQGMGILALFSAPGPGPAPVLHLPSCLLNGTLPPKLEEEDEPAKPPFWAHILWWIYRTFVLSMKGLRWAVIGVLLYAAVKVAFQPELMDRPKKPGFLERLKAKEEERKKQEAWAREIQLEKQRQLAKKRQQAEDEKRRKEENASAPASRSNPDRSD